MKTPENCVINGRGDLYDCAKSCAVPIRRNYSYTHRNIKTTSDLLATLRAGKFADGCPMFFITSDGAALSFDSVRKELASILYSIKHKQNDGWRVVACDVNWEDNELYCAHSGEKIESACGDDE